MQPFELQYVHQIGDVNGDGVVLNTDAGLVNVAIPWPMCPDDTREDVNGDGFVLNTDSGLVNVRIPSAPVSKPTGH